MQPLNYPVMKIASSFIEGQITSEDKLTTAGEKQFESGCFDNCYIIDSQGYKYEIISSQKVKRKFSIFNYNKNYRSIVVSLNLSDPQVVSFQHFKEEIINKIIQNKWYGADIGVYSENELKAWIDEAKDFESLIMISDIFSK